MDSTQYDDDYVKALFDRMGRTYDLTNVISSFGFSEFWRWQCVAQASIKPGQHVCDMMAGTGECWRYILRRGATALTSVDFSHYMAERQRERHRRTAAPATVLEENAIATALAEGSVDHVVSAFGLKTLNHESLVGFACEIRRILKPGGTFSLIEISYPKRWILSWFYRWYLNRGIPFIGKFCLGDIDCYRMLGEYTRAFGSCASAVDVFREAGLEVEMKEHFFGCATSLVGCKPL
ncbi:MAG TPA: class I SAM-dependent methyltransferase [Candidatus Saccharimonadia bacterium]|nr:class I SAM-dependent methyltransferase [Candidatus Saccharimonadia bacterium]